MQQAELPAGERAARALPRDGGRRLPQRGGRQARDGAAPARPDRAARAGGTRCSTWAAGMACCSTRRAGAGYEVTGIELSSGAAEYAREVLELDVLEEPLEGFAAEQPDGAFQVVVLADVLEHLDDPVAALTRLRAAARARRGALRDHARPVVGHRAPGRAALVGVRAGAHVPASARDAARAARGARARDLRGRSVRPLVRAALLARRPGRARRRGGARAGACRAGRRRRTAACRCRSATSACCSRTRSRSRRRASR